MLQSHVAIAVGGGLLLGLALGGRITNLADTRFRFWALLPLGLALQVLVEFDSAPIPTALLIVSYVYLVAFCAANLHIIGMGVVLIGIALNALVITANGGMPVRVDAARAAHLVEHGERFELDEVKHHVEDKDSTLMALADIIPVRPFRQVLSFGDLIVGVGMADLLAHLVRGPRRRREPVRAQTSSIAHTAPA
jgi:hypothetical protein